MGWVLRHYGYPSPLAGQKSRPCLRPSVAQGSEHAGTTVGAREATAPAALDTVRVDRTIADAGLIARMAGWSRRWLFTMTRNRHCV